MHVLSSIKVHWSFFDTTGSLNTLLLRLFDFDLRELAASPKNVFYGPKKPQPTKTYACPLLRPQEIVPFRLVIHAFLHLCLGELREDGGDFDSQFLMVHSLTE